VQEARLFDFKWYAALAYVRANRLNHNVIAGPHDRFGIIASGKAFNDTRQALADLGLDDATCRAAGHPPAQGERGVAAGSHHHA
jgi:indolepyruvate ferredoxin oxidoreductase